VVSGTCDDPVYVLADCTSLTGVRFSSVTGLPAGYAIEYGANRIALVRASAALLLIR